MKHLKREVWKALADISIESVDDIVTLKITYILYRLFLCLEITFLVI